MKKKGGGGNIRAGEEIGDGCSQGTGVSKPIRRVTPVGKRHR